MTPRLPPLSLYVHLPWCVRKCPYCDFNSYALQGELPETPYVAALLTDLAAQAPAAQGRALQSLFLGGGTPSLFSAAAIERLLDGCRQLLELTDDAEVTLEANPGTVERGRFAEYRAAGITRVSLGAQSFSDAQLQSLGRIHAAADTRRAAEELHAAGLTNFNLDLMYGLPAQTLVAASADVEAALQLCPAHLSHYQLTLEPGTPFAARPPPAMPSADLAADLQCALQERLASAGFQQYEVAAYARGGARCRHNLNYWRFGDYIGIGAGAHGKLTWPADDAHGVPSGAPIQIERTVKSRDPRRYMRAPDAIERRWVPAADLPFEFAMNALRLTAGFSPEEFERYSGLSFGTIAPTVERLGHSGLMEETPEGWHATARGFALLNDVLVEFLPERAAREAPAARLETSGGTRQAPQRV